MSRTISRTLVLVAAFAGLVMTVVAAQAPAQAPSNADAARLRTLFFQRNYETAVIDGARLVSQAQVPQDVRAWYVLNLVRRGQERPAVSMARKMVSDAPTNAWSWFALAGALNYQGDDIPGAIEAGARAFQMMPDNPDAIWIHAQTMASDATRRGEAIAFVDSRVSRVSNPAELLVVKGSTLYSQSYAGRTRDESKFVASLAAFEEARRVDPTNLNAHQLPGQYLSGDRRADEAHPLLKKAIAIAPSSTAVHQAYWNAVNGSLKLSREEKTAEIEADMTSFLAQHGTRPGVLFAVSSMAGELKQTERKLELEETVLSKYPGSTESEWIVAYRWREFSRTPEGAKKPEYRKLLSDYIARPSHSLEGVLGEAYRNLFSVMLEDQTTTAEQLKPVLDGMIEFETTNVHITHASAIAQLADRKLLLDDAERIARGSMDVLKKKIDGQREVYANQGEYERGMNWMVSMGHDALGWVLFNQGRTAEAEQELLRSYDMYHESRTNLLHLGKLCEATGNITRAEQYYVKGMSVQAPGVNPCETALKALYEKRSGSLDGFDKYLIEIADTDRMRRKEKVLGDRLAKPEAAPAFNLRSLDGARVSLESLKGKIVVINFWGIWCGWCIQELPEFQKLHEKYKGDAGVAILTIDNDRNPDDVAPWMKEKKYTFPVLFDDGFVAKAGVASFPTTWFIDREGRRVFAKVGWSEKLLEEFAWRIEAIR